MAEAFVNLLCPDEFEAHSAGLQPGRLNPAAVEAMKEIGIDISRNRTKNVSDFINQRKTFEYVITVCDEASAERCPVFPGQVQRLHWAFADPSAFTGTDEQKLTQVRTVRDETLSKITQWLLKTSK